MPLCLHYLNGNCKYGSKCFNEHLDVKTIIKTDAESALNGKQFALSSYGPFKEVPAIPNFITDRSFEEVRMGYIESAKTGTLQQYLHQIGSEYADAIQKLNTIKQSPQEIVQVAVSLYNNNPVEKSSVLKPAAGTQQQQQLQQQKNPFQSSNIFGGASTQQMSTASIFGGSSSNTANPFQSQSMFGQSALGNANQQTTQPGQIKSSIFGASSMQTSSMTTQPSSIFGGQSIFGPTQSQSASIFGGGGGVGQTTNIFSQAITQQPAQTSMFGSSVIQTPTASIQPQSSIFSQAQPMQNAFQQNQPAPGMSTSNMFCAQMTTQQPQEQPAASQNIFGAMQMQQQPMTQQQNPAPTNIFQTQQYNTAPAQTFGNPFQLVQAAAVNDEKFYSKPEEISPDDAAAFQAETFVYGKIPLMPPPKSLCM